MGYRSQKESLKSIFDYIKKDSPSAANRVKLVFLELAASLKSQPFKFSKEPFLEHKGRTYRSITKWSYKMIYRVEDSEIRILKITHTKRNSAEVEKVD